MNKKQRVLIIGHVWPEPTSTAAGSRMLQLIEVMLAEKWELIFTSAAQKTEFSASLKALGVIEKKCALNDVSFQLLVKEINPSIVIYDRFLTEEQFGWRVREVVPQSLQVLDTEDLHFLRKAREEAVKKNEPINEAYLFTDLAKREIGAMLRCDLSLIISEVELKLLQDKFQFAREQLLYLPFLMDTSSLKFTSNFTERKNLVSIGNFLHAPNWDQVLQLKNVIWPVLRKQLKGVELHIYGAYTSEKVQQLHNPKEDFIVCGRAENAQETLQKYRLLLAPLRFGAGLKGKIIDAFSVGTPVVTSSIGAEGMIYKDKWPGAIEDNTEAFSYEVTSLYEDESTWIEAQLKCKALLSNKFEKKLFVHDFIAKLNELSLHLSTHRERHFVSQIFSHHQVNAQKFMSLWIEEKNKYTRK